LIVCAPQMCLLENTPTYLKCIYKLIGIVQFSYSLIPKFPKIYHRLWSLPLFCYFIYLCVEYNLHKRPNTEIFFYIDHCTNYGNILSIHFCFLCYYQRSNSLRMLLLKLTEVKPCSITHPNRKYLKHNNWYRLILIGLLVLNFIFFPFYHNPSQFILYMYYFGPIMHCFDILFLNDVLNIVLYKFEMINQHLRRRININVQHVQELSLLHHRLVHLATDIVKNFETTIIAALIMWFESVLETVYYTIFLMVNGQSRPIIEYGGNLVFLTYCFSWFFIMIGVFSRVQNKANETATLVHDIWNECATRRGLDERMRHLQLISLRLLNTKLRFTAKELFFLDWTFCHTVKINVLSNVTLFFKFQMIAAVATYVVILIQFQI
jgi:hypothetical protein